MYTVYTHMYTQMYTHLSIDMLADFFYHPTKRTFFGIFHVLCQGWSGAATFKMRPS